MQILGVLCSMLHCVVGVSLALIMKGNSVNPWTGEMRPISAADFRKAAVSLNVSEAVIRAVFDVEAAGRYYRRDGTVERRFEPHHFMKDRWASIGFKPGAGVAPWRASLAIKDADREAMFARAVAQHPEAAMRATSWGAPQIMGFNHLAAGYPSAQAMVHDMADSAASHLSAFVAFVQSKGLSSALRAHDWLAFSVIYNGDGQAPAYARKIEAAYRKHAGKSSAVVLKLGSQGAGVVELQEALGIDADGGFGPKTLAAVKAFQLANGLAADGVVGDKTWDAIRRKDKAVLPPAQETELDIGAKVTAAAAALTAGSSAVAAIGETLPEAAVNYLVAGAAVAGVLAVAALLFVKVRERVR